MCMGPHACHALPQSAPGGRAARTAAAAGGRDRPERPRKDAPRHAAADLPGPISLESHVDEPGRPGPEAAQHSGPSLQVSEARKQ